MQIQDYRESARENHIPVLKPLSSLPARASTRWSLLGGGGGYFDAQKGRRRRDAVKADPPSGIFYIRGRPPSESVGDGRDCFLAGVVMRFSTDEIDATERRGLPPLFQGNGLSGRATKLVLSFYCRFVSYNARVTLWVASGVKQGPKFLPDKILNWRGWS